MDGADFFVSAKIMMAKVKTFILGALLALLVAAAPALAQDKSEALPQPLSGWQTDLERIEEVLRHTGRDDGALIKQREQVEGIGKKALSYANEVRKQLKDVTSQLDKLGPAPKAEEAPESEAAAKVRQDITAKAAELDGAIRTAEVLQTRADQISGAVQQRRRSLFSQELLNRVRSPLKPVFWQRVSKHAAIQWQALRFLIGNWWADIQQPYILLVLMGLATALWAVLSAMATILIARCRAHQNGDPPPYFIRTITATGVTLLRALPPIASASALVFGLWSFDMLHGKMASLMIAALTAFCIVAALLALIQTVLAPNQPQWRVLPISDRDAKRLRWLAGGVAGIIGADLLLTSLADLLYAPIQLTMMQSFVTTVAVAVLLGAMLRIRLIPQGDDARPRESGSLRLLRMILSVLVIAILIAACLGFIALARFMTTQIVVVGSILILLYLLHAAIEELSASLYDPQRRAGRWLAGAFNIQPRRHAQIGIIVSILLHALLILLLAPLIALQWGFDWEDVRGWMSKAIFGFSVGDWRISLGTIFVAILFFVLGLFITRFVQQWLDNKVLQRAQFETGPRSAIRTGVGYLGVAIAGLVAVSYAGLDFSNVAIVAGALSVGIGFGLQSIVNNFVSGLILLAEQRISVGDWIIVGTEEGHVRRISVRATEIETFDRNFVIIPNSELITQAVKNWTFQHRRARLIIDIGVSYATDPETVREILLRVANQHPATTDQEKTRVLFQDFGDSALMFQLRAFVADVSDLIDTRSELRYAIMEEFRKEGVEIPFPQRDIHLKDIDRLEAAIAGKPPRKPATRKPSAQRSK